MSGMRYAINIGLISVIALAVGLFAASFIPQPKTVRAAPFVQKLAVDDWAHMRKGTVRIIAVEASKKVHGPRRVGQNGANTGVSQHGLFLIVTIDFQSKQEPSAVSDATITDRKGRVFGGTQAVGDTACGTGQPKLTIRCQLVFEMPKGSLEGAMLTVPAGRGADDVAQWDLGIDAEKAKQLESHPVAVRVYDPDQVWGKKL